MFKGKLEDLTIEELRKVYLDDIKEQQQSIETYKKEKDVFTIKETQFNDTEKELKETINKLKLTNYDLIQKVNVTNIKTETEETENIEVATVDDILKDFR